MKHLRRNTMQLLSKIRRKPNLTVPYKIGDLSIDLTFDHSLPKYQSAHPYYDRFLPHLVRNLDRDSIVVDVGANVGDTAASIVSANDGIDLICIEADEGFFSLLEKNVLKIKHQRPKAKIALLKKLVGSNLNDVKLVGQNGSKHVISGGNLNCTSLHDILVTELNVADVRLIKSDVDGFDYEVIKSAGSTLDHKPLLYFECQYDTDAQFKNYLSLFEWLQSEKRYDGFLLFDNFGQYIGKYAEIEGMKFLFDYVARQNFLTQRTRTIYYYDVLAFSVADEVLMDQVIQSYLEI